jgi:cobalt/nickel transport system ATP-binding protein
MGVDSPLFSFDGVSFEYPDGTEVFSDIDLTIERGDFVVLLAPNGGGKSTFLKLLCGLLEPTSGTVQFEGKTVDSFDDVELYREMGFVFQNPDDQLFGATVREDIAFGPRNQGLSEEEVENRVRESLESVNLDVNPDKAIHRLSFGQKKRVALAGILAMGVDTLLLDEPTGELDPLSQESIFGLLKTLNQDHDKTIVAATHHIDLLGAPFETLCVLADTDRIVQGEPEEIFKQRELLEQASLRPPIAMTVTEKLRDHGGFDMEHTLEANENLWDFLEEHFFRNY